MPQTGIEHLRTCAEMIDRIVAREMCERLTGSCIIACHSSTASTEKTKLHSSAWEVLTPWYASSETLVEGTHKKSLAPHFSSYSWNCRRWLGN